MLYSLTALLFSFQANVLIWPQHRLKSCWNFWRLLLMICLVSNGKHIYKQKDIKAFNCHAVKQHLLYRRTIYALYSVTNINLNKLKILSHYSSCHGLNFVAFSCWNIHLLTGIPQSKCLLPPPLPSIIRNIIFSQIQESDLFHIFL